MSKDYFPQGVADGYAFLDREEECRALTYNIEQGHHTLLVAPRRFGKTSLARHVLSKLDFPFAATNFYLSMTEKSIEGKILAMIHEMVNSLSGKKSESLLRRAVKYFSNTPKKWSLGLNLDPGVDPHQSAQHLDPSKNFKKVLMTGEVTPHFLKSLSESTCHTGLTRLTPVSRLKGLAGIEFTPETNDDIPGNIITAFEFLEFFLKEQSKRVVIFLDEIQELHDLENGRAIQGAIREFAQNTKTVAFIFSGSNRKLLNAMFDDRSMPLYELCERVELKRISEKAYRKYINSVAKKTKGGVLSDEALDMIFSLTERHPKRVYNLCYQLWKDYSTCKMSKEDVMKAWAVYIDSRVRDVNGRLKPLSIGQLKILTLISDRKVDQLTGKKAQHIVDMAGASISKALSVLEKEDLIAKDKNGKYYVIDPLVGATLWQYERFNLNF